MAKQTFITFLKQNHAFEEWKREVEHLYSQENAVEGLLKQITVPANAEYILRDGWFIHYNEAITPVRWDELHKKWISICHQHNWIKDK